MSAASDSGTTWNIVFAPIGIITTVGLGVKVETRRLVQQTEKSQSGNSRAGPVSGLVLEVRPRERSMVSMGSFVVCAGGIDWIVEVT